MKEQFVTYDIALKLKELGFDGDCLACYTAGLNDNNFNQFWYPDQICGKSDFLLNTRICKNSDFSNENSCSAILWQQCIYWFREVYDIHIIIQCGLGDKVWWSFQLIEISTNELLIDIQSSWNTYNQALLQALKEAIKLIKK